MIKVSTGFQVTSADAIDARIALTKDQMKAINDNQMPDRYFTICQEDGKIYLYDKSKAVDENTGRFRVFEGSNSQVAQEVKWTDITGLPTFHRVSETGDYNDLINTPDIPEEYDDSALQTRISTLENAGYATEQYVNDKVAEINGMNILVVAQLPTENIRTDVIYMMPSSDPQTNNLYEEYLRVNKGTAAAPDMVWEKIGEAKVDLTGYATETYVNDAIADVGSGKLSENLDVSVTVGGYNQGDTITKDTSLEAIIKKILSKIYIPTYTAPSLSLACSLPTLAEVGATVTSKQAKLTYNAGSIVCDGKTQGPRGGNGSAWAITLTGADDSWNSNESQDGTFTVPDFTKSSKGEVSLSGTCMYAEGPQPKDSAGNNYDQPLPEGSLTSNTIKTKFILPFYYGASSTANITDFSGLTKDLKEKGQKQYSYTTDNQHMVIAYDASYGNLSSILDPNSFELKDGWTSKELTVGGQLYKVYVADSPTTDTATKITFKF